MNAQNPDPTQIAHAMAAILPVVGLLILLFQALIIVPLWIAMKKAGVAPALSLIALIPTLGIIIALFILAFSTWKVAPVPQYADYRGQMPPQAYPPVYSQGGAPYAAGHPAPGTPAGTNYTAPGAYAPAPDAAPPAYPPPPDWTDRS